MIEPDAFESGLLVCRERIAPGAHRAEVFLHGGVVGVELADRLDVVPRLHHGDEGLHPFARRHGSSLFRDRERASLRP